MHAASDQDNDASSVLDSIIQPIPRKLSTL